jgi:hypothetical protein
MTSNETKKETNTFPEWPTRVRLNTCYLPLVSILWGARLVKWVSILSGSREFSILQYFLTGCGPNQPLVYVVYNWHLPWQQSG